MMEGFIHVAHPSASVVVPAVKPDWEQPDFSNSTLLFSDMF